MDGLREMLMRRARAVWQRRWIAIAAAWLVCLAGWYGVMAIPNTYEANARLYVDADAVLTPLLRGVSLDSSVSSELDNLQKLIAKTDLDLQLQGPADRERMVARLQSEIRVVPQTRNLFTITYRNGSPKLALDVVQNILTTFVESKIGNNRSDMENAGSFIQAQIDKYEAQLRDAERKRAEFRVKYLDLLPADGGGVSHYEQAAANVKALQGRLEDVLARRASLSKELLTTPPLLITETGGGGGGGGPGPNAGRIAAAQQHLAELRLRYTDDYPEVRQQIQMIEALRSGSLNTPDSNPAPRAPSGPTSRSVPNPVYEQLKVRLVENEGVIASVQRQLEEAQQDRTKLEEIARGVPGLQAEFINLNRDYDVIRRNYDELLSRREQMRISAAADADANQVKMQIVDPPQMPQTPVAPQRIVLLTGVLFAGLGAGVALALMLGEIDSSFQNIDDLRSLGLPVIGGISVIAGAIPLWRRLVMVGTATAAFGVLCVVYGGLVWRLHAAGIA
jgi:polysaccharide chain length determinant protein (PEP-CTERM system associated)